MICDSLFLSRCRGIGWASHILRNFAAGLSRLWRKGTGTVVSHRGATGPSAVANPRHFRVSPRFVNDMVISKRDGGGPAPQRQGHRGHGKLACHAGWVRDRLMLKSDLTLDEISAELQAAHGRERASWLGRQMAAPAWPQS